MQPEYEGFSEWLQTFDLYRGKKSEEDLEDENRVVGKFKVRGRKRNPRTENLDPYQWDVRLFSHLSSFAVGS